MNGKRLVIFSIMLSALLSAMLLCVDLKDRNLVKIKSLVDADTNLIDRVQSDNDIAGRLFGEKIASDQRVFRPLTTGKRHNSLTAYDINLDLPPETAEGRIARDYAKRYGAQGKVTLYVIDAAGEPVGNANVSAFFWTGSEDIKPAVTVTDNSGFAALEGKNMSYVDFSIQKQGYYDTRWRYWFSNRGYNCVENGRWIPWNPVLEVVLKEHRNPTCLIVSGFNSKPLPRDREVGFDFALGDYVSPDGIGERADVYFYLESDWTSPLNHTNKLVVKANENGGLVSLRKDSFSEMKTIYAAPATEYVKHLEFSYARTSDRILHDMKPAESHYIVFKSQSMGNDAHYGTISDLDFGGGWIKMQYLFNPNPSDPNLEPERDECGNPK